MWLISVGPRFCLFKDNAEHESLLTLDSSSPLSFLSNWCYWKPSKTIDPAVVFTKFRVVIILFAWMAPALLSVSFKM